MKIALCLFGHAGGIKDKNGAMKGAVNIRESFDCYKKTIIQYNDVDIFIHSWSHDLKQKIIDLYKPKISKIENQIDFSIVSIKDYSSIHSPDYSGISNSILRDTAIRSSSRWYSNSYVLKIMKSYSQKHKLSYDYVFQGRLDLLLYKKIDFLSLNKDCFYCPSREKEKDKAVGDLFFISSQENAEKFSTIYKNKNLYSIRPVIAAKQHLEKNNIKTREYLKLPDDFTILRYKEDQSLLRRFSRAIKNPRWALQRLYEKLLHN